MFTIETWKENEVLRNISSPIKSQEFTKYIKLWKEMVKYIKNPKNAWVWLAAPQIGQNVRLIVVSLLKDREDENFQTLLMINPTILEHSTECEVDKEWCLSLPWDSWEVARYSQIKLSFIDENKKERKLVLSWLSARIVQHEIDHLDGVLFTDKLV